MSCGLGMGRTPRGGSGRRLEARRLAFDDVLHARADELLEPRMREYVEAVVADRLEHHLGDLGRFDPRGDLLARELAHDGLLIGLLARVGRAELGGPVAV